MLLLSLLVACRPPAVALDAAIAPPAVDVPGSDLAFYDVAGTTSVDVVESLVDHAPGEAGVRHAALTEWQVVWRYPSDTDDTSASAACDLDRVDVDVSILTTFPRWDPPAQARTEDVAEWHRYTLALAEHETDHARIVRELADTIPGAIRAGDCAGADGRGLAVLDAIRAASAELDTDTLDGATTGAELAWVSGLDAG